MDARILVNAVGTAAGLCSMSSFLPQLIKIAREKRAEGVSLRTYIVTVTGFCLWIVYGVMLALRWRYGEEGRDSSP